MEQGKDGKTERERGEREAKKKKGGENLKKDRKKEKEKGKKDEVQSARLVSACPGGWETGLSAHAVSGRRSWRSFLESGVAGGTGLIRRSRAGEDTEGGRRSPAEPPPQLRPRRRRLFRAGPRRRSERAAAGLPAQ